MHIITFVILHGRSRFFWQHFVKTTFSLSLCFLILCGGGRAMEVSWAQRGSRRKNEGTRGQCGRKATVARNYWHRIFSSFICSVLVVYSMGPDFEAKRISNFFLIFTKLFEFFSTISRCSLQQRFCRIKNIKLFNAKIQRKYQYDNRYSRQWRF